MKPQLKTLIIDPKSSQFSASRLGLMMLIITDIAWVLGFYLNINSCPQYAVGPVCLLLGAATGSVAGVYWGSTYTSGYGGGFGMDMGAIAASIPPIVEGIRKAKKKREQDGV